MLGLVQCLFQSKMSFFFAPILMLIVDVHVVDAAQPSLHCPWREMWHEGIICVLANNFPIQGRTHSIGKIASPDFSFDL